MKKLIVFIVLAMAISISPALAQVKAAGTAVAKTASTAGRTVGTAASSTTKTALATGRTAKATTGSTAKAAAKTVKTTAAPTNLSKSPERISSRPASSPGGETAATRNGRQQHKRIQSELKNKNSQRKPEVTFTNQQTGKNSRVDVLTPNNRPFEIKPDSASGRQRGTKQLKGYEGLAGRRGGMIYYDSKTGKTKIERTPYSEWKARKGPAEGVISQPQTRPLGERRSRRSWARPRP